MPTPSTVRSKPKARPATPPAPAPLYAPPGGLKLRGEFYQGGEEIPSHAIKGGQAEIDQLRNAGAHFNRDEGSKDLREKPAFGKGEIKKGKAAKVVGEAEVPAYADEPVPQPGGLTGLRKGQVTRQHLPEAVGKHLTDPEIESLTETSARHLIDHLNSLPPDLEYAVAAKGGEAKRGWYARSHEALVGLFGQDADKFALVLAATSPQTAPKDNLRNALHLWGRYLDYLEAREQAGRTGPVSYREIRGALRQWWRADQKEHSLYQWHDLDVSRTGELASRDKTGYDARMKAMEGQLDNVARALSGEVGNKPLKKGERLLSGQKVDSFGPNLQGDPYRTTIDVWQGRLGDMPEKTVATVAGYLANTIKTRRVADLLNRKYPGANWTPAEVQETTWSFIRGLAYVGARSRDRGETPLTPIQTLAALTHETVAQSGDFLTLVANDPVSRNLLRRLGLGEALDRTVAAYEESKVGPTPFTGPAVSGDQAGPEGDALRRVARRAAQYVPSFSGPQGRKKYARGVNNSLDTGVIKVYSGDMATKARKKFSAPPAARYPVQAPPVTQPQAAPAAQEAAVAASPNLEDDLSFDEAVARSRSGNHAAFKKIVQGVSGQLGLKGQAHSAIGDWEDGAENSVLQTLPHPVQPETVRYAAAWYGLLGNQRAVMLFHPDPKGHDSLYTIDLKGETDLAGIRDQLSKAGVPFRTLVPTRTGTKVVIYDQDRKWRQNVAAFAGEHGAVIRESVGSGSYLGGPTRSAARAKYRSIIAEYEANAAKAGTAASAGTVREVRQAAVRDSGGASPEQSRVRAAKAGRRAKLQRTHAQVEQARTPLGRVAAAAVRAAWLSSPRDFEAEPVRTLKRAIAGHVSGFSIRLESQLGGPEQYDLPEVQQALTQLRADPSPALEQLTPESLHRHAEAVRLRSHLRTPQGTGLQYLMQNMEALSDDPSTKQLARDVLEGDYESLPIALDAAQDLGLLNTRPDPQMKRSQREWLEANAREAKNHAGLNAKAVNLGASAGAGPTSHAAMKPQMGMALRKRQREGKRPAGLGLTANPVPEPVSPVRAKFSGVNAPAGGVVVRGMYYPGGHFIPKARLEKATWDQYQTVEQRRQEYQSRRRPDGSYEPVVKMAKVFHARDLVPTEPEAPVQQPMQVTPKTPRPAKAGVRSHVEKPADPAKVAQAREAARKAPADPIGKLVSGGGSVNGAADTSHLGQDPSWGEALGVGANGNTLPAGANPKQAREYISRLYNIARDFDSDVEAGTTGMTAYEQLLKRHALWEDILRAEKEYRDRAREALTNPGRTSTHSWTVAGRAEHGGPGGITYTPEEQRQIIQRHNDVRAIRDLAHYGLLDVVDTGDPEGNRHVQDPGHLSQMHLDQRAGRYEKGLPVHHGIGELSRSITGPMKWQEANPLENAAYEKLGSPAYLLVTGRLRPSAVESAIRQIRAYGVPLNPERARQHWAQARQDPHRGEDDDWTLPSTGTAEDPNYNPHI